MKVFQYVVKCWVIDEQGCEEYFSLFDYPELMVAEDKCQAMVEAAVQCAEEIDMQRTAAEEEGKEFAFEILVSEFCG